ncbi:MAG: hypothetical protein KVP17_003740 [Porospora cf. gigantea B]|uniref:uncharacterized protein n=1 Tax=Porospora cf. gigantea B TaxID=2853592 RepID=UPI003571F715|nr:MAG: hypothetical protein KVP17_003740 [Porospora cf. gigantea B]
MSQDVDEREWSREPSAAQLRDLTQKDIEVINRGLLGDDSSPELMPAGAIPLSCASLLTEVQLPAMPSAAQPVQFRVLVDEHELLFDRNRLVGRGGSSTAYQCRLYDRQWEEEKQPIMRKIQLGLTVARKNMMKLLNPASPLAVDYHRIPLRLVDRGTDFDEIHSLTELVIKHADDPKALQHENRVDSTREKSVPLSDFAGPETHPSTHIHVWTSWAVSAHTIRVIGLFDTAGPEPGPGHFLLTEYLDGPDLAHLRTRMTPSEVKELLARLTLVLGGLHAVGVVHGDLKCDNVRFARRGEQSVPILFDFGSSALLGVAGPQKCAMHIMSMSRLETMQESDSRMSLAGRGFMSSDELDGPQGSLSCRVSIPVVHVSNSDHSMGTTTTRVTSMPVPDVPLYVPAPSPEDDWHALGVLMFELIEGSPPWGHTSSLSSAIISRKTRKLPLRPPTMKAVTFEFISMLLEGQADVRDIVSHPFFADFDWPQLLAN